MYLFPLIILIFQKYGMNNILEVTPSIYIFKITTINNNSMVIMQTYQWRGKVVPILDQDKKLCSIW
jgi:chemotaxis signal transduction protein